MRISVSFKDDVAIMALTGKFVAGSDGPFLRQKVKDLIDAGATKLVLDFTEVPYIDSTGLGFLAGSRVTAQNAGVSVVLAGVNQHVRRILDGVRLTPFFVLAANEVEAVSMVNANAAQSADSNPPKASKARRSSKKNSG
jgi:anti-sigma B factor antagonist